jgi:hypothetical protein
MQARWRSEAERYRAKAREAQRIAAEFTDDKTRGLFRALSRQWSLMASMSERRMREAHAGRPRGLGGGRVH